jgi:NADH-quinone oxidoreductase subunit E
MAFALTPERDRELTEILTRYPTKMAACIPALHLCQDQNGWISDEVVDWLAHRLDLPPAHVKGVVTFYTLFNQRPVGKHQLWVCRTLPCALRGAGDVLAHCEKRLGIKAGETTSDGKVTLRTAECLASCGTAPMVQVDRDYHENLTLERLDQILTALQEGLPLTVQTPRPTAGSAAAPVSARPQGSTATGGVPPRPASNPPPKLPSDPPAGRAPSSPPKDPKR